MTVDGIDSNIVIKHAPNLVLVLESLLHKQNSSFPLTRCRIHTCSGSTTWIPFYILSGPEADSCPGGCQPCYGDRDLPPSMGGGKQSLEGAGLEGKV